MLAAAKLFRTDYACRLLVQDLFGRGFDSPRLHQIFIARAAAYDNLSRACRRYSMQANLAKYKIELERLTKAGTVFLLDLVSEAKGKAKPGEQIQEKGSLIRAGYQRWYSEAREVVRQILPSRLDEFDGLYKGDGKKKAFDASTYTIQDWLLGIRAGENYAGKKHFNDEAAMAMRFQTQFQILESASARFESALFDIRQVTQADLFDSELEAAKELLRNGFLRPAGVLAGVVLENHLAQVCENHQVAIKKKNPSIGDLNDALKQAAVLEIENWRFIGRLGDLRNLCGHDKKQEPKNEQVSDLIGGTEKITKTLF